MKELGKAPNLDLEVHARMRCKVMLDNSMFIFKESLIQYLLVVKGDVTDAKITDAILDLSNLVKRHTGKEPKDIITT